MVGRVKGPEFSGNGRDFDVYFEVCDTLPTIEELLSKAYLFLLSPSLNPAN